jgi:superfamily II DNA helicase RecQ
LFIAEKIKVVVATTAFGMGIDKSNIRFVIHYNYPASIEGYYQEIGRAGRDGEASYCYLLFNPDNRSIHEHLAAQSNDFNQQKRTLQLLKKMEKFCTSSSCRMVTLLEYFNEKLPQKCRNCDKCRPTQFLTDVQIKKFKQLQIVRSQLQKKFKLGHEAEVLTDNQLLQLVATNPVSIEDFLHLTGFGKGWLDRWHNHFLSIDVKIQIDTHQGKYV